MTASLYAFEPGVLRWSLPSISTNLLPEIASANGWALPTRLSLVPIAISTGTRLCFNESMSMGALAASMHASQRFQVVAIGFGELPELVRCTLN